MAIIYSYPLNTPKRDDLLIGTITYDEDAINPVHGNPTVSFTVGSLLDLIASQGAAQNLQQVTNIGNTTTNSIIISNSIKVSGGYYDSSSQPGTAGQLLSSTATGTQWVNVAAQGVTSVGLSMPAAFTVANSPITQAGILTVTGAGTAAQYINGLGNLITFPTIPTQYVLPVATTVALGGIKIGYSETGKNYALKLDNERAYVNVPWTDTLYTLPLATDSIRGGVKIGYTQTLQKYPVELLNEQMFVDVPWTDTPYTLPVATSTDLGGVKIGYTTDATARNYAVSLDTEQMLVNVPWTDTQNPFQTITGTGTDNTDSGVLLSNSGGTVKILGDGTVITAAQTGNTITLTGVNTWVANAVTVAGYVAAPAATDANLVWKTDANGNPAWRVDATIPDTGITGVTLATADSTGAPLAESIAARELTLTSSKYVGGANVGYVPEGGTSSTYLKGDGTWAAIPTGLIFKGTWDASGGSGGSPDLTLAANKGAGFLWICDVAGTAYPNGGTNEPSTWNLGDWCVYDGSAWTRVPATNSGVTSITTTDGTYIDLTPASPTAATGAVTVTADISATVVSGSIDSTKFLRGDNKWAVPAYIPNTDETYELNAGAKVSTSVPINLTSTSGTDNSLVNLKEGTNVTLTRGSATEITIAAADNNTQNIYTNSWQQSTNDIILRKVLSGAGSGSQDIKIVKGANITFTYTDANNFTIAATDTQENTTWYIRDSADADKIVNNSKYLKLVTATGTLGTALTGTGSTSDPYLMTLTSPDTNTQLGVATSTALGGIELGSDVALTATYVTGTAGDGVSNRAYPVQLNADRQAAVYVPWSSGGTYDWEIKDNQSTPSTGDVASGKTVQFVGATGALSTVLTDPNSDGNFVMTLTSPNDDTLYALAGAADGSVAANYNLVLSADGTAQDTMIFKQGPNVTFTRAANSLTIEAANDNDNTTYDFLTVQTGGTNDDPALRLDPSTGSNDDVTLTGGSNMTITRNSDTQITFDATNTWIANALNTDGYVEGPVAANANQVWKCDASGNPGWLDDATGDNTTYSIASGNTKVITLTGSDSSTSAVTFADGTGITISGNNGTITITNSDGDTGLPAIIVDDAAGNMSFGNTNVTASTVRAQINAGTGDGIVTSLTTTGTSGASTLTSGVLNIPNYADTNYYLDAITKANNTLTFSVFGPSSLNLNQTYTFGANAFNSTTIPTNNNQLTNGAGYITSYVDTTYSAGNGITFSGTPATVINANINYISYDGSNNFIDLGSDLLGSAIPSQGIILYRETSNLKIVSKGYVEDLPFTNNSGTVTSVTAGTGMTQTGTSTDNPTLNVIGSNGVTANANNITMSGSYNGDLTITGDTVTDKYRFRTALTTNPSTTVASIYDQSTVGLTLSAHNVSIRNYTGSAMVESARFTNSSLTVVGDLVAYGVPSDKNYKENIKPIESALDKAMKLQGVTFDWKKSDSILDIKEDIGFIAQDVQKVLPELVRENVNGKLSLRHQGITPILLEAIKELKAEIEELKSNKCNCNK